MPRYPRDNNSRRKGDRRRNSNDGQGGSFKIFIPSLSMSLKEAIGEGYSFAGVWQYGCDIKVIFNTNKKLEWLKEVLKLKAVKPSLLNHLQEVAKSFKDQGYEVYELSMTTAERLIVGLGEAHYLETGIKLSKAYGIPYISGSTLKGAIRSFYEDLNGEKSPVTKKLFGEGGDKGKKGSISFLDLYPEEVEPSSLFEVEVMNPHYSKYYTGNEAPGDWMNPVPIFFLVVKPGIRFRGLVIVDEVSKEELDRFKIALREVLEERGVGGKKTLGYGLFKDIELKPYN